MTSFRALPGMGSIYFENLRRQDLGWFVKVIASLLAVIGFVAASAPASAEQSAAQQLYRQTEDGWFIYIEDRSCVLYGDFAEGIMVRFSHRADENRIYFSIVGETWNHLRQRIGQSVMIGLEFPELERILGSVGMIIRNPDGRMGYTGNSFGIDDVLRYLSTGGRMAVKIQEGRGAYQTVARMQLRGGAVAAMHLAECNERHFPD